MTILVAEIGWNFIGKISLAKNDSFCKKSGVIMLNFKFGS